MEKLLEIFEKLKKVMTVSGYESINAPIIRAIAEDVGEGFFDSSFVSPNGSIFLVHRSKKKDARTLLIDAHFDTIGLTVAEILSGGFVRCANIGGIDRRILTTAEVEIYGKRVVRGLFSSVPPHLANKNGDGSLPDFADFLVDTGLSDEELEKTVSVGDPAVFIGPTARLLGNRIASAHLDDKLCCASVLYACKRAVTENIDCNVTVLLSSGEETGEVGAKTAAFVLEADGAVALDVNFAKEKDVPEWQSSRLGDGAMISRSAATDRRMTDIVIGCAVSAGIPHKVICEVEGTGTNADALEVSGRGTPASVLSIPIRYMHTPCETADLADALAASDILLEVMKNFEDASRSPETHLGVRILKGGEVR